MARIATFRRHLVPLILLALLALLPGLGASFIAVGADVTDSSANSVAANQRDPAGNYTLNLPTGWKSVPAGNGTVRFTDLATGAELLILTSAVNGRGLDQAMQEAKNGFEHQKGYRKNPVGEQDLTLGGQPAIGIRFYSDSASVNQTSTVVVAAMYKGNVYLLTFLIGQDEEKAMNSTIVAILNSWQFI